MAKSTGRERKGWFWLGVSRGAFAGLLTAVTLGVIEAALAGARGEALSLGQLAALGTYAIGLLGLVVVPLGAFIGAGLAAITRRQGPGLGGWLEALACDHERDVQASATLVGAATAVGVVVALGGAFHYALVHDLQNKTMASAFVMVLLGGAFMAATLSGVIAGRLAEPLLRRLPLEALGRPHLTKLQGVAYLMLGGLGAVAAIIALRFYDPQVWAPMFIVEAAIMLLGPAAFYGLLARTDPRGGWSGHPALLIVALVAAGALASPPIVAFERQPEVREASFSLTELERRVLNVYMKSFGDRDGDGFAGLFGGPDCDDANPAIHPAAVDLPANGVDENCVGGDAEEGRMRDRAPEPPPITAEELARWMTFSASTGCGETAEAPPRVRAEGMNLVFILIDTVRVDHLGYAGYERATSPALDALAAESVVFDNAYAHAPNTPRSVPSLLTSRYPSEIAWRGDVHGDNFCPISPDSLILQEVLAEAGYRNHFVAAHWYFEPRRRLEQGFAEGGFDNATATSFNDSNTDITSPRLLKRALDHLDRLTSAEDQGPWSLMIHLPDPHGRYMKHPGAVEDWGDSLMDKYDQELRFVDDHVAQLLEALRERGLADDTVIVVTSDHGEAFGEHQHHFHGQTLYEEILRVPLIIHVPGATPARIATPVELIDVAPTLLDAFGIAIPDAFHGRSLLPAMRDPALLPPQPVYAEHLACPSWDKEMRALIDGQYKIVWRVTEGLYELYDLKADPGEQDNIIYKNPELASRMKAMIVEFVERELTQTP